MKREMHTEDSGKNRAGNDSSVAEGHFVVINDEMNVW